MSAYNQKEANSMNKPESIFVKNLPYLCLIGVIALGLITIVGSNGGDDGDGTPGGHVGGGVEITWVEESGLTIATAQYSESGFLTAYMCYSYFEVTGGSGEVEISVDLESSTGDSLGSQTTSFDVEQGQSYQLSMEVKCSGPSDYDPGNPPTGFPNEFTISFSSPSVGSPDQKTIQGGFYTDTLSLGELSLDSWEYTAPQWTLEAKVSPEGSGSISDSLGLLVYEGEIPGHSGEYYVGEYEHGTEVTLTATPAQGYTFKEWYGTWWTDGTDTDPSVTFTMTIPTFIEARFIED